MEFGQQAKWSWMFQYFWKGYLKDNEFILVNVEQIALQENHSLTDKQYCDTRLGIKQSLSEGQTALFVVLRILNNLRAASL